MTAVRRALKSIPPVWLAALLAVLTAAVFAPSLLNGFVEWDDEVNFVKNPHYRGLGSAQLGWMFTTTLMGHWIPVTWLTFGLDYVIWGMNPLGYHLSNVVFHALAVGLAYLVALRLLGMTPWERGTRHVAAAAGALFFGLHPLRAESVAWITERRDVLSTALFLLSILLYLRAHDAPQSRRRSLALSLGAFGLAIASKSMVMTLPAVLLILDVYPLRRIRFTAADWPATRAVLIEKIPYAVLGVIAAGLGIYGQASNAFLTSLDHASWSVRIALTLNSYWFYLWKTLMPIGLGPMYELPTSVRLLDFRFLGAGLAVLAIAGVVIAVRRRLPVVAAAFAAYLVTLAPVSGIAHAGFQLANDRYSYLPSLSLSLLVGVGVGALVHHRATARRSLRWCASVAVAALLVVLSTLTWQQVQIWKDSGTLWQYAVDAEPACSLCRTNLGVWLTAHGSPSAGADHLRIALAVRPDRTELHRALGVALMQSDRIDEALAHFEQRRAVAPDDVDTLVAITVAHLRADRLAQAQATITRALALAPANALVRVNHATVLRQLNRREEALAEYRQAVALDRQSAPVRYAYAWTLASFGQREAALEQVTALGKLDPKLAATLSAELTHLKVTP